uniref:E3 ubiquitin-protein ligase n=1 Tax=Meloidogyne javanica TaxID=6303 RepID=A0A915MY78_MELJA
MPASHDFLFLVKTVENSPMMVNSLPAGLAAPQQIPQTSTHAIVAAVINPAGQGILPLGSASSELLSAFECPGLINLCPYQCPCPGASCKWQGGLNDVMGHLMKLHKSITTLQGEDIVFLATDINLPGAVDW